MSFGSYVVGVGAIAALMLLLGLGAHRLRVRLLPDWSGSLALLVEAIIFLALLFAIAQLLGAVGALHRGTLLAGAAIVSLAIWWTSRSGTPLPTAVAPEPRRRSGPRWWPGPLGPGSLVLVGVVLWAVVTPWLSSSLVSLRTGIWTYDSLNYHLPYAARFFQDGHITELLFASPGVDTQFHPANSELLHAVGMLAFGRDLLSPWLNLGWLSLGLLAAWCAGQGRGLGHATLAAGSIVLTLPLLVSFDGGQATNDIADVALLLAAVAVLINGEGRLSATGVAATAAGLGLANKLSMVAPIAVLTFAVIAWAGSGRRRSTAGIWLPVIIVTGGFWYVRNVIVVHNPIPALNLDLAGISLPSPEAVGDFPSYSVAHYATDFDVWRSTFRPGLRSALGWLWPLILALAASGWVLALLRRDRTLRALGAVGLVSFLAYLITPATAGGPEGQPLLFGVSVRFAFPALAIGLVLFPLALPRRIWSRAPWALPLVLAAAALSNQVFHGSIAPGLSLGEAVLAELVLVALVGLVVVGRLLPIGRPVALGSALVALLMITAIGWRGQRSYLEQRYADPSRVSAFASVPRPEREALYGWARDLSNARIAVAGLATFYPLFGTDLSNKVRSEGERGPHGAFNPAPSCRDWRRRLNDGHYDYVVTSANFSGIPEPIEARWTRSDDNVTTVLRVRTATVFRVNGAFDPDTCPSGAARPPP